MKHQSGRPCIRISLTFFLSFPTITCNTRTKLLNLEFFDFRYRRNLKAFYIVHPTVWAKIVTWFFTTFTASSIKEKVHFLSGIQYLYDWIDPDQLEIPAFVLEYDMKVSTVFQVIKFSYATLSLSACERRCLFRLLFHALSNESRKGRLLRKRPNFSCMQGLSQAAPLRQSRTAIGIVPLKNGQGDNLSPSKFREKTRKEAHTKRFISVQKLQAETERGKYILSHL